ncbi:MAG: 4-hydroxythreonine-4-phosphate dehydrogenase PdxA [Candidatus Aminicenantes bacterium]|nr:4-hydroxythreonine-4-phosphate dehydrogenase PdxA [Candidatus Aminicenantes bacterium]
MIKKRKLQPRKPEKNKLSLLRLGLTIGDPAGIGPEILVKALAHQTKIPRARYLIFGPEKIIKEEIRALGLKIYFLPFSDWETCSQPGFYLFPIDEKIPLIEKGKPSSEAGQISFLAYVKAIEMAQNGQLEAVVTAPISKLSWSLAGLPWRGHTEYLEQFYPEAIMAFWSRKLKVALVSHHISLRHALEKIKFDYLLEFFRRLEASTKCLFDSKIEFLVAGLNPHAGEDGLLGDEEKKEIIPAIAAARQRGMSISGPYPPDVVFRQALNLKDCLVIALYHDQGLIAFKLLSFEEGVNVTLGLPFVRTSPDHGTAFDIAPQRKASEKSMLAAINLAYRMVASLPSPTLHFGS